MTKEKIDEIKETFDYDGETGELIRKKSYHSRYLGRTLGSKNGKGYMLVRIGKSKYSVHRLAWIITHGYDPDEIDHINHDITDNRICNLREVSRVEQMKNRKLGINNKSGRIGVYKSGNRWSVNIGINGGQLYLGTFESLDEACSVRDVAEKLNSFHKNHGMVI